MNRSSYQQTAIFLLGTAIGTTIGLILAALFTPYSGPETRRRIKEQSVVIKDRVAAESDEFAHRIQGATDEWVGQLRVIANDLVSQGQMTSEEASSQINQMLEKVRS